MRKKVKVANNPDLMTEQGFCDYAGIVCKTSQRWAREGKGPKRIRIGQRVYYYKPDVDAWIEGLVQSAKSAR